MNRLKISVLLPAFNAARYIRETINSILSQTYPNFELLIADDGSSDNTRLIIDQFDDERIRTFHSDVNLKKPLTVQRLFNYSYGNLITVHDADDISLPHRFERIVSVFETQPDIFMCGHAIERISESGKRLGLFRGKISNYDAIKTRIRTFNSDGDPSIFIRREVIVELGEIFRPYFNNNMDYDLVLRVIEKYKTTNLTEVLSYYRNVPNSISKGVQNYRKLITEDITKFLADERREGKRDALQRGDYKTIEALENKFAQPYINDATLYLRKMAAFFMYVKMNKVAIAYMWDAVKKEPMKFANWRTLQYCVRKTYLRF